MSDKKISMFDYLKVVTTTKDHELVEQYINSPTFNKTYKSARFTIQRYLSMSTKTMKVMFDQQQILDKLEDSNHLRYLVKIIPKVAYIKYIK